MIPTALRPFGCSAGFVKGSGLTRLFDRWFRPESPDALQLPAAPDASFAGQVQHYAALAKAADPNFRVFGASAHKYRFPKPAPIMAVRRFEEHFGIILPENYVKFLTEIGNGGAGPNYGLYSIDRLMQENEFLSSKEPFLTDSLTEDEWNRKVEILRGSDEAYETILRDIAANAVIIGTEGCTCDMLLMCSGSECGKIVCIDWDFYSMPYFTGMEFSEWLVSYFKEIACGYKVDAYGSLCLGTADELRRSFADAESLEEKRKLLFSFRRFPVLDEESFAFICRVQEPDLQEIKLTLIMEADIKKALPVFDALFFGRNPACCFRPFRLYMPENRRDRYYKSLLELLYSKQKYDDTAMLHLIHAIGQCRRKSARDIAAFIMDQTQKTIYRCAALYVMGDCRDAGLETALLIALMRGEDHQLMHSALQASISANLRSEEIWDTYQWLMHHYHQDPMIQNHLGRLL